MSHFFLVSLLKPAPTLEDVVSIFVGVCFLEDVNEFDLVLFSLGNMWSFEDGLKNLTFLH